VGAASLSDESLDRVVEEEVAREEVPQLSNVEPDAAAEPNWCPRWLIRLAVVGRTASMVAGR
jgi:hypothetical protein